jgi:hypothetical protein
MAYKLDDRAKETVLTVVTLGGTLKMAAEMVGCSERAVYQVAQQDADFKKAIRSRRNSAELNCLRTMNDAAENPKNWAAAFCLLKSLRPERYARPANTIPIKEAKVLMKELANGICSAVTSDQSREEILAFTEQAMRSIGSGKRRKQPRNLPQKG